MISVADERPYCARSGPSITAHYANDRFAPILLQKSKIEELRKSRESRLVEFWLLHGPVGSIPRPMVVLMRDDVVPHVVACKNAPASLKNFVGQSKKAFSTLSARSGHSLTRHMRRSVFIDPAQLIGIVLFCTDASAIGHSDYCLRNFPLAGSARCGRRSKASFGPEHAGVTTGSLELRFRLPRSPSL
jgi:hypothetical protein